MNKLVKKGDKYILTNTEGKTFECKTWDEKKDGKVNQWVVLPKNNGTGRTYISRSLVDKTGTHEFEDKVGGPRIIGSRLTPEAQKEVAELEAKIKAIKADPKNIVKAEKLDANTVEGCESAIAKLQAKLEAMRAKAKPFDRVEAAAMVKAATPVAKAAKTK